MPDILEPSAPSVVLEPASVALDKIVAEMEKTATTVPATTTPAAPDTKGATTEVTPADPKTENQPPNAQPSDTPPATEPTTKPDTTGGSTPPAESSTLEKELSKVELPPHARPKSAEAFSAVKQIALQHEQALRKEIADRDAKLKEFEEKTKAAPDPKIVEEYNALKTEVEQLRAQRAVIDVRNDPKFKEFDGKAERNNELVYSRLLKVGLKPEQIEKIKSVGGPGRIDWDQFEGSLSKDVLQFVRLKVAENIALDEEKQLALSEAEKAAPEYLTKRAKEQEQERLRVVAGYKEKADWLKPPALPANATPEQKAQHAAELEWFKAQEGRIQRAVSDTSPEMHATLAVGNALAFEYSRQLKAMNSYVEKLQKETLPAKDKEIAAAKADLKKVQDELDRIKKASRGGGSVPATGGPATAPTGWRPGVSTEQALDELAAQAQARMSV